MAELEPVDAVEVTLVVDNYVDILMAGAEGAVNVLGNAKRLTGRDRIAGFVGGFHLTGAIFEPVIDPTITAFTELGVERFVPGHCTGWKATHRLAQALPDAFVQPSVGTVLRSSMVGVALLAHVDVTCRPGFPAHRRHCAWWLLG